MGGIALGLGGGVSVCARRAGELAARVAVVRVLVAPAWSHRGSVRIGFATSCVGGSR